MTMKQFFPALGRRLKAVCWLPPTVVHVLAHRRRQAMRCELEAERLDRIRHPEKYRGK
jgi:hypothetical protein